jgi:hypothetical protein
MSELRYGDEGEGEDIGASRGPGRGLGRTLGRTVLAGAVAIGFATAVSGCGVQPTSVNVAQSSPFDFMSSSSSQSAATPQGTFSVSLFLLPRLTRLPGSMVVRLVDTQVQPMDLPALLAEGSPYSQDEQYTSSVPAGITLKETNSKHQYYLSSPVPLTTLAVQQLTCTFDQYWLANPDSNPSVGPATRFIGVDGLTLDSRWQDCQDGVVPVTAQNGPAAKPSVPEPTKSATSG